MSGFRELLAGAGGGTVSVLGSKVVLAVKSSTIFTAPVDMELIIRAFGGGGSGGLVYSASGHMSASGAGAGGTAVKRCSVKAGQQFTITVGAGGSPIIRPTSGSDGSSDGANGGATSVVGPGVDLVAGGGKGGKTSRSTAATPGGLGGEATGGDFNLQGGRGGNIPSATGSVGSSLRRATGGGATNIIGFGPFNGGDMSTSNFTAGSVSAGTGGGGVGQSAPGVSHDSGGSVSGPGGGLGALNSSGGDSSFTLPFGPLLGLYPVLGPRLSGPGYGGAGTPANSSGTYSGFPGGVFAGGGGAPSPNVNENLVGGGGGDVGGGGGGLTAGSPQTSYTARSGSGGAGLVILEFSL